MSLAHETYIEWQKRKNTVPIQLEPETTALVIIDMQEWVVNPASAFCRYAEKRSPGLLDFFLPHVDGVVIPNLGHLVDVFRECRLQIIYTTIAAELPDGRDWIPTLRRTNAVAREEIGEIVFPARSDPWSRITERLAPRPEDVVINKTTYSSFASTGLARDLATEPPDSNSCARRTYL